jgi:putative flippase GtrA
MMQWVSTIKAFRDTNRVELTRFFKFALVGTIGAGVDFAVLNLGIQGFGLEKWVANTISFSAAVLSNFIWNRFWTYPESRRLPLGPQLAQFVSVNLVGLGINQLIFLSLDRYLFSPWGTLGYNLAKAIAIGVVLFWNYGINRIWTYRKI